MLIIKRHASVHLLFEQFINCTHNFNGGSGRAIFGLAGFLVAGSANPVWATTKRFAPPW